MQRQEGCLPTLETPMSPIFTCKSLPRKMFRLLMSLRNAQQTLQSGKCVKMLLLEAAMKQ